MELILEVGTEEIPVSFIILALKSLKEITREKLSSYRISFKDIETLGTPRRLVLHVTGIAERQTDEVMSILGPPKRVAFDKDDRPTQAAIGFARSQGVDLKELKVVSTEKGEYLCIEKAAEGNKTEDVMPQILHETISSLTFPKSMRWGESKISFARPIHWILAVLNGRVVPFSYGSIESGSKTYGHPFLSPEPIDISSFDEYKERLQDAHVFVEPYKRKDIIIKGLEGLSKEVNGRVHEDEELLEEVTFLVENPVVIRGGFPERFLELPKEVLIHVMKDHQRYFSIIDGDGNLLPYFIAVANTPGRDINTIIKGNERVLRARLEDARFFFEEDRKMPLHKRVEGLKGVVFQSKLGTSYEKMERFRRLSNIIAEEICPDKLDVVDRVAYLCKADLLTEMVGEFPDLQGVMGREYALLSGEDREVADGIYEHYLPLSSGGELPKGVAGAVVGIADRLDTIVGCFSVGLIPTGTADPYGLRRKALSIINIILDKGWRVSLTRWIDGSLKLLKDRWEADESSIREGVCEFFSSRLFNQLTSSNLSHDVVDATLSSRWDDPVDVVKRAEALESFKSSEHYRHLALTVKRVMNITKGAECADVTPALLKEDAESSLFRFYTEIKDNIEALIKDGEYALALKELLKFKAPVDRFFDEVMVMVDDRELRDNRLALLTRIGSLFYRIADFSRLVIE